MGIHVVFSEGKILTYNVKWQMAVQRQEQISALTGVSFFFFQEKILAQTVLSRWGCVILNRFESLLDSEGPTELIYKLSQISPARREKASLLVRCKPDRGQVCLYSLPRATQKDEAATSTVTQAIIFHKRKDPSVYTAKPALSSLTIHLQRR